MEYTLMPGSLDAFSFFSSAEPIFDRRKSLTENFNEMCSLTFKPDSEETKALRNYIQQFEFTEEEKQKIDVNNFKGRSKQRQQQVNKLETVILALELWCYQRRGLSTRVPLIENYKAGLEVYRNGILAQEYNEGKDNQAQVSGWYDVIDGLGDNLGSTFNNFLQGLLKEIKDKLSQFVHNSTSSPDFSEEQEMDLSM